jgi:nucleoside-diphosphate-sugar epimerase
MNQWIAVTGATGFIGQSICRRLHESGYKVRALVRSETRASVLGNIVAEFVYGDLADKAALNALARNASAVVHCAGAVRGANRRAFDRVNVEGVSNLVDVLLASERPPSLICLSSLAAREPGLSFYAASKRKGEQVLEQQARGLNWIALRPPAVYGPGDRELLPLFQLMSKGICPRLGAKDSRFSMIFVDDIARLVRACLQQGPLPNGIYSLHDGKPNGYSWSDLSATAARLCQRTVREIPIPSMVLAIPAWINRYLAQAFRYAPMLTPEKLRELRHPNWVCDNEAIQRIVDWQPQVSLEEGLRRTPGWCSALG